MKSKTTAAILKAYQSAYSVLVAAGLKPRLQRLDNEASAVLKAFLHDADVTFQLAPPRYPSLELRRESNPHL
jgi:hypothetical protein